MSVYTPVTREQLESYLQQYNVGKLIDFQGIEAGVENTNYFVTTTEGPFVLTLVESISSDQLPFILDYIEHLTQHGVACAEPIHLNDQRLSGQLNDRPAVLMSRLAGSPLQTPNDQQASVIGVTLAQMHQLAEQLENKHAIDIHQWCSDLGAKLMPHLAEDEQQSLHYNLMDSGEIPWESLPAGPVHADLFPDNALFEGDKLCGLIDFYHACSAPYLYDLCVTLNAWCYDERTSEYDFNKALLMLDSYQSVRPLNSDEQRSFSTMLQVAAMRFWLSRLRDIHFRKEGEVVTRKDPQGKLQLLKLLCGHQQLKMTG
ncbi:homoserine kinase [Amphritea pacifica]|uniref:Homoserine kinase n=1 Tax=Amphritea pacifica TaxID=2811233 RepID=A0ABS2W991_9GAMM|nr:homoserine kinase [Amphritea pacifica]MBN0988239.1 homoserine kinase [Amphritea pacifica]MBN1008681.1 homoserine kinase [Amphritea pacifica]